MTPGDRWVARLTYALIVVAVVGVVGWLLTGCTIAGDPCGQAGQCSEGKVCVAGRCMTERGR